MSEMLSKEVFLAALRRHLRKLPAEEIEGAVAYYQEYIDDAGAENEHETIRALGSPRDIALQLLKDRALDKLDDAPPSPARGFSAIWTVILAVFASPIALPLALALAAVAVALIICLFAAVLCVLAALLCVVVAIGACAVASVVSAIAGICFSIPLFFQHAPSAFFLFGASLVMAGLGALLTIATVCVSRAFFKVSWELLGRKLPRFVAKIFAGRKKAHA